MTWEKVTIGGLSLRESQIASLDGDALTIGGREMNLYTPAAEVLAAHHNIPRLTGRTVPVVFEGKAHLTGYYRVDGASSSLQRIAAGETLIATWSASLVRIGGSADVEIESRVPTIARSTTVSSAPAAVFWHAPAIGAGSYFTGATVPAASVTRTSADGPVTAYLGIPAGTNPRWTAPAENYLAGSARLLVDGLRRVGSAPEEFTTWEVNNGLVQLTPGATAGTFTVSCWQGGAWRSAKTYAPAINGVNASGPAEMTVLRNDPEEVTVRLTYPSSPGRLTVDLGVRRGARIVTGVLKRHSATSLGITRTSAEAATAATGGLRATAADADGNRFVMGSAATTTAATGTASLTRAAATALDFFLGHEVGGAPAGDLYADLWAQYRGSTGERALIVTR